MLGPILIIVGIVGIIIVFKLKGPGGIFTTIGNWTRGAGENAKNIGVDTQTKGILSKKQDELDAAKRALDTYYMQQQSHQRTMANIKADLNTETARRDLRISKRDVDGATVSQQEVDRLTKRLADETATLSAVTTNYEAAIKRVNAAQVAYQQQKAEIQDLSDDMKTSAADAAAGELISGLTLGEHETELAEAKERIRKQIDRNRAVGINASRLGSSDQSRASEDAEIASMSARQKVEALMGAANATTTASK